MRANWLADIPPFACIRVGPQETKSCYEVKNVDQTYQELLDKIAPKGMQKIWIIC